MEDGFRIHGMCIFYFSLIRLVYFQTNKIEDKIK